MILIFEQPIRTVRRCLLELKNYQFLVKIMADESVYNHDARKDQ